MLQRHGWENGSSLDGTVCPEAAVFDSVSSDGLLRWLELTKDEFFTKLAQFFFCWLVGWGVNAIPENYSVVLSSVRIFAQNTDCCFKAFSFATANLYL